jgi:histone deacetylase 6
VAIIDWDYHFGDGTAETVKSMSDVMFVSLHCMRDRRGSATYPYSMLKGGQLAKETGGRCFNVAWFMDDADDAAFAFALTRLILPALERFAPDVILISAGYDALRGDDLAGMELTPAVFRAAASALRTLGLPLVAVLEGGYNVDLLAEGVAETVYGMLETPSRTEIEKLAMAVKDHHRAIVEMVAEQL